MVFQEFLTKIDERDLIVLLKLFKLLCSIARYVNLRKAMQPV